MCPGAAEAARPVDPHESNAVPGGATSGHVNLRILAGTAPDSNRSLATRSPCCHYTIRPLARWWRVGLPLHSPDTVAGLSASGAC